MTQIKKGGAKSGAPGEDVENDEDSYTEDDQFLDIDGPDDEKRKEIWNVELRG